MLALKDYGVIDPPDAFRQYVDETDFEVDDDEPSKKREIDNLMEYIAKFNMLLATEQYELAAMFAANSPDGIFRNMPTFKLFQKGKTKQENYLTHQSDGKLRKPVPFTKTKNGQADASSTHHHVSKYPPTVLYAKALMATANGCDALSGALSKVVIESGMKHFGFETVRFWLGNPKLTLTLPLADLLHDYCRCAGDCRCGYVALALYTYDRLRAKRQAATCLLKMGRLSTLLNHAKLREFSKSDYKDLFVASPSYKLFSLITKAAENDASNSEGLASTSIISDNHQGTLTPYLSFPYAVSLLLDSSYFTDISQFMGALCKGEIENSKGVKLELIDVLLQETFNDGMSIERWERVADICKLSEQEWVAEEICACLAVRRALDEATFACVTDYFS